MKKKKLFIIVVRVCDHITTFWWLQKLIKTLFFGRAATIGDSVNDSVNKLLPINYYNRRQVSMSRATIKWKHHLRMFYNHRLIAELMTFFYLPHFVKWHLLFMKLLANWSKIFDDSSTWPCFFTYNNNYIEYLIKLIITILIKTIVQYY